MSKIRKLIKEYSNNLTDKEIDYLKNFEVKTSNFYGLSENLQIQGNSRPCENCDSMYIKINRPTDLKIRPIIAGPSCSTQRLSNLLDILLKPLCIKVPSFVRDDMDFLNYIPDRVPLDTILVSFDVISLYTNIPHELGLKAVQYWLEKYLDEIPELQSTLSENNTYFKYFFEKGQKPHFSCTINQDADYLMRNHLKFERHSNHGQPEALSRLGNVENGLEKTTVFLYRVQEIEWNSVLRFFKVEHILNERRSKQMTLTNQEKLDDSPAAKKVSESQVEIHLFLERSEMVNVPLTKAKGSPPRITKQLIPFAMNTKTPKM
ncbi:unnamed protein product [Mytilus edulis]|uniref:Reverse transcriptase domain-containing protein n=1 Tax=Mytilus edulis TaxID=6550 RepID=A0A8S3SLI7_MYTED|nr:unnamed protein product [Mytilus edulis]